MILTTQEHSQEHVHFNTDFCFNIILAHSAFKFHDVFKLCIFKFMVLML